MLVFFKENPRALAVLKIYTPLILLGYSGAIILLSSLKVPGLSSYFELWTPLIEILRHFLPVFDISEREFSRAGFAHRLPIVQHLLTIGWLTFVPAFVYLTLAIPKTPHSVWMHIASGRPRYFFVIIAIGGAVFFFASVYWGAVQLGYINENILYARHRNDAALLQIGGCFYFALISSLTFFMSVGALLVSQSSNAPQ